MAARVVTVQLGFVAEWPEGFEPDDMPALIGPAIVRVLEAGPVQYVFDRSWKLAEWHSEPDTIEGVF
jgi:hypothetical protein